LDKFSITTSWFCCYKISLHCWNRLTDFFACSPIYFSSHKILLNLWKVNRNASLIFIADSTQCICLIWYLTLVAETYSTSCCGSFLEIKISLSRKSWCNFILKHISNSKISRIKLIRWFRNITSISYLFFELWFPFLNTVGCIFCLKSS